MNENHQVIQYQVNLLKDSLSSLLPTNTKYALLDFPDHPNVGDSAIWLGEIELLKQVTGNHPSYVCTFNHFDFEELDDALPDGPILLHGGGNFGDIWPWYQDFREQVIKRYPDRLIIQLPQTTHFKSQERLEQTREIINAHPNFHLFVRDVNSQSFAEKNFSCPVKLLPDSAFCIGPLTLPIQPIVDILLLLRTDDEKASYDTSKLSTLKNCKVVDWLDESQHVRTFNKIQTVLFDFIRISGNKHLRRHFYFRNLANARLKRGLRILASGNRVITDRLHAHILSILLNIEHGALDNNYGKISSYIQTWTHIYPKLYKVESISDAITKMKVKT
jgi:pyruvyl transferase EpsO